MHCTVLYMVHGNCHAIASHPHSQIIPVKVVSGGPQFCSGAIPRRARKGFPGSVSIPQGKSSCPQLQVQAHVVNSLYDLTEKCYELTLLLSVLDTVELVDARTEVRRITPERDLERREKLVHAGEERLRGRCGRGHGWLTLEHDDAVREVRRHDEVVLNHERGLLRMQDEPLDNFTRNDTLLRVEKAEVG